jgi:hypothetical protein
VDELQLQAWQSIEIKHAKMKQSCGKRIEKPVKVFREGDLVMAYDPKHCTRAHKKLLPKFFGPYQIMQAYKSNGTYI